MTLLIEKRMPAQRFGQSRGVLARTVFSDFVFDRGDGRTVRTRIIGITGGVACGKSSVAALFEQAGARRIDADRLGHEVLTDPAAMAAIRDAWGSSVFDSEGRIDRRRLAAIVFAPPPEGPRNRAILEGISHPKIGALIEWQVAQAEADGCPWVVVDAALLFEAGWNRRCSQVVFVEAPPEARRNRAAARGWSDEQFLAREAAQWPPERKRAMADCVIDNAGNFAQTAEQVRSLIRQWGVCSAESAG